jgi:hypothetical protein
MDAEQFDTLARSLTDRRSRRGALASLLGGSLGLVGLTQTEAKAKKTKPCPPCKKRKKGKCKPKPAGTACTVSTGGSGRCQNGACIGPRECTTAATCPAPPASLLCAEATCVGGICRFGPKPAGTLCRAAASDCDVAEVCDGASLDCPANQFRPAGTACTADGNPCTINSNCNGSGTCIHPPVQSGAGCGVGRICCGGTCCTTQQQCKIAVNPTFCCGNAGAPCTQHFDCCSGNCANGACFGNQ